MQSYIILAACMALANAIPTTTNSPEGALAEKRSFNVDLTDLANAVNERDTLTKRDSCPSQQTCVGHRCVMLECEEIAGPTTTCITFKYGDC